MSEELVEQLVAKAQKRRVLEKGSFLFHEGDRVRFVYVVEEGLIELARPQLHGASITLQRATAQAVLAEASVYSDVYHCDAHAAAPSAVFQLSKNAFLAHLKEDRQFSEHWAIHLAREVQAARYRSEILSRKTVRGRLEGWMAWPEHQLPEKGRWKSVAEQIGVSPAALYRELARRK